MTVEKQLSSSPSGRVPTPAMITTSLPLFTEVSLNPPAALTLLVTLTIDVWAVANRCKL